jgi:hypothetical protein
MAKKIEEHAEYIYVDFNQGDEAWFASDIFDSKEDAIDSWKERYYTDPSPLGFFLEVILPLEERVKAKTIEQIPVYRV